MSGSAELDDNVINATVGALFNKAAFYRDAWEKYKKGGEAIGGQAIALAQKSYNFYNEGLWVKNDQLTDARTAESYEKKKERQQTAGCNVKGNGASFCRNGE